MAHNLLTKAELGFFYENRKKLDNAIGEILGPGIHLHQFSQSSDRSADISSNSYGLRNPEANKSSNVHSVNSGGNKKSQKNTNEILSNFNLNENKLEKLSKQNMELQKKLIKIKDQNIQCKNKSDIWQKLKQYVIKNLTKQLIINPVKPTSSDAVILDELISYLGKIVEERKNQPKQTNTINQMFQMENNDQMKKKLQQQYKQVQKQVEKLRLEIEHLKNENNELKNKQREMKKYWRARLQQSQQKANDQINNYKKQTKLLNDKVDELSNGAQKMKKVISLAQNLNNEFMVKLEDELKKSRTTVETQFNDYGQSKKSFQRKRQPEESFHFANRRFKIVKSKSVQKQRFMYGQKDKDKR